MMLQCSSSCNDTTVVEALHEQYVLMAVLIGGTETTLNLFQGILRLPASLHCCHSLRFQGSPALHKWYITEHQGLNPSPLQQLHNLFEWSLLP